MRSKPIGNISLSFMFFVLHGCEGHKTFDSCRTDALKESSVSLIESGLRPNAGKRDCSACPGVADRALPAVNLFLRPRPLGSPPGLLSDRSANSPRRVM